MGNLNQLTTIRDYYQAGNTRGYEFRRQQLLTLKKTLQNFEQRIYEALKKDLNKSPEECWVTENGFVISEIDYCIKNLQSWMKPQKVPTNLANFSSKSYIISEPLGVVLIISPWNYPLQLLLAPLVGAIAAGNCVVLKPSELAPATSALLKQIIEEAFNNEYIFLLEGDGSGIIPEMMNEFVFDHLFYTGSTAVGKIIYELAAKHLVPVTLELGGKSPCIVETDADIKVTARRIVAPKFSNAGQMCVAPDYILAHSSIKDELLKELQKATIDFFGKDVSLNSEYCKIINEKQFDRLKGLLHDRIIYGGNSDRAKLFISPTIVEATASSEVMKEEIFGPILPVISFNKKQEALDIIAQHKDPLAFYVFTSSASNEQFWVENVSFGSGCINNVSWHLTNHNLPFGGRGYSGTGNYHGKFSFDTFSHKKSLMKTPTWFDPSIKYPPLKGKLKFIKMLIGK